VSITSEWHLIIDFEKYDVHVGVKGIYQPSSRSLYFADESSAIREFHLIRAACRGRLNAEELQTLKMRHLPSPADHFTFVNVFHVLTQYMHIEDEV